jgi:hypothetical protein
VELNAIMDRKNKVPTNLMTIGGFDCMDCIQAGCLLKLDKININQFISLGQSKKVFKLI